MDAVSLERIGFWGLLAIYLVRDALIPLLNKYIPSRINDNEREQDRLDKKLEFEQKMQLRHVEALEGIKDVVATMSRQIHQIESYMIDKKFTKKK